ncbi:hypothetical protein [Aestuariirhabdus sp. LZHN29]|uniref:hypothetical protein n=1 Tax=Aestuariirhabdus sp. LZHN29 TaxID=3417462 RepID=UPI003CEB6CAA
MIYGGVAVGVGLSAVLLLYVAYKLLRRSWLIGWLRGSAGLLVLAGAAVTGFLGWDLYSYTSVPGVGTIATVSFTQQGEQRYSALVANNGGGESLVELQGELWRMDVRQLRWNSTLRDVGLGTGYRLADITARYLSIEQEQQADRQAHPLVVSPYGIDSWNWIRLGGGNSLVEARLEPSSYLPIVDKAIYRVDIEADKVEVVAVNEPAKTALARWK